MLTFPLETVWSQISHPFSARFAIASTNLSANLYDGTNSSSPSRWTVAECGLLVDLWPSNYFSFVTGLEYQQRSGGQSVPYYNTWYGEENSFNIRYQYVSIPLLLRYRYPSTSLIPYALGGFGVNINLKPARGEVLVLDATIGAGIRAEEMLPIPIFIEGRYSIDVTPAQNLEIEIGLKSIRSNSFNIAIGIAW